MTVPKQNKVMRYRQAATLITWRLNCRQTARISTTHDFLFSSALTCNLVTDLGSKIIYHFASNTWTIPQMDAIPDPDNMSVSELERFCDTPLQTASYKGDTERVQELIEAGADPNAVSGFFGTALQAACYRGHYHVSGMLLKAGAVTKPASGYYGNPVQAAACGGHAELIGLLIRVGADIDAKGGVYGNALVGAAKWGHEAAVIRLTENGADLDEEGNRDYPTALYAASLHGRRGIVERLLHWGADPNKEYGDGKFALLAAVQGRHKEVVSLLIKYGALLDKKCDSGLNIGELTLRMAVEGGHTGLVRLLLSWTCIDKNLPNKEGLSPLLMAVSHGNSDMVRDFLYPFYNGIDFEARDRSGSTALMIAVSHGYLDVTPTFET